MKSIFEIDPNFTTDMNIDLSGLDIYDAEQTPFKLHGLFREGDRFRRIPEELAKEVSPGVLSLHANCSGGRIRFKTDAEEIAIIVSSGIFYQGSNSSVLGMAGLDLYADGVCRMIFTPPMNLKDGYSSRCNFDDGSLMRNITINMPSYGDIKKLYIGLSQGAKLLPPDDYEITKPIVYYGSSITQGGTASRPGNIYQNVVLRSFEADYINLGFSGSAKGEDNIGDYIAGLDMSLFVMDYDHNAPSVEHLKNTHERFFKRFREKQPTTPVLMLSRPEYVQSKNALERIDVIESTYKNAIARGDKNVYFICGKELMKYAGGDGMADTWHPNDLGFHSMGRVISEFLTDNKERIFGGK